MSREVGDRLGGAAALAGSGAFAEVAELAQGGLWLLATENFADYDLTAAQRVFDAVAPALPPGEPFARTESWDPPRLVVIADPAKGR